MADLLNTGMRIRHFRILRGMTQKVLGVAVGFPESSADVRIAQYESGARTPKRELLCQLAAPLGVSPSQFTVPRIKNSEELCSLLAALEDECGIELSPRSENAKAIYQSYWKGAETLQKTVTVEADSREEAERQVEESWNNSEYILDADSFVGVDFSARTNERSREYEQ